MTFRPLAWHWQTWPNQWGETRGAASLEAGSVFMGLTDQSSFPTPTHNTPLRPAYPSAGLVSLLLRVYNAAFVQLGPRKPGHRSCSPAPTPVILLWVCGRQHLTVPPGQKELKQEASIHLTGWELKCNVITHMLSYLFELHKTIHSLALWNHY